MCSAFSYCIWFQLCLYCHVLSMYSIIFRLPVTDFVSFLFLFLCLSECLSLCQCLSVSACISLFIFVCLPVFPNIYPSLSLSHLKVHKSCVCRSFLLAPPSDECPWRAYLCFIYSSPFYFSLRLCRWVGRKIITTNAVQSQTFLHIQPNTIREWAYVHGRKNILVHILWFWNLLFMYVTFFKVLIIHTKAIQSQTLHHGFMYRWGHTWRILFWEFKDFLFVSLSFNYK